VSLDDIKIGLLFSLTGTTSVTERGQYQSALLAIRQVNAEGGVLGKKVIPVTEDIASDPILAAKKAEKLICQHDVTAFIGLYTSACRKATIPVLEKYNKLLFYPTLYEGEEFSPQVIYCGPVPNQQLERFIPWIVSNLGLSLYLVGSDYVYPRKTHKYVKKYLQENGGIIAGEAYVMLGNSRFQHIFNEISKLNPDVIFSTLVGDSAISFYRQFREAGFTKPIASPITAETEVHAMGAQYGEGNYSCFPYFSSLDSPYNSTFKQAYKETFGTEIISAVMESTYYSVWLLVEAIRRAESLETDALRRALRGLTFQAPQGTIRVDDNNQHLWLQTRIARVNQHGEFEIVWESDGMVPPLPFHCDTPSSLQEAADDDVVVPIELLREAEGIYNALITVLRDYTKSFPYHFVVTDKDGLILSIFCNDTTPCTHLPSFIRVGVRMKPSILGRSGPTLSLSVEAPAIIRGPEHEREELRDWISIGIPIRENAVTPKGILAVFAPAADIPAAASDVLISCLSQLIEAAIELTEECHHRKTNESLFKGLTESIGDGYIALENGHILAANSIASKYLTDDPSFKEELSKWSSEELQQGTITRLNCTRSLVEIRSRKMGTVHHLFIKRLAKLHEPERQRADVFVHNLVGSSRAFLKNLGLAELAAKNDANVLILGESGTGKELFARYIHERSARRNKPFVAINCAAIPRDLLAAELFGYVEGAFTGAKRGGSPGKFEIANGGTLFLDEIGDMPIEQQATLLRVLQEKEIVRLGGTTPIPIDVRIISATNKQLSQEIAYNGTFRSDLYYRLNVFTIELAPLRQRREDIPELVRHFIRELAASSGYPEKEVSEDALDILVQYTWPGNIRELRNCIERAFYVAMDEPIITPSHLPQYILHPMSLDVTGSNDVLLVEPEANHSSSYKSDKKFDLDFVRRRSAEMERTRIEEALVRHQGNISRCARELGMSRTTLYRKLKEYGLY
jgi:transcriptional regulator with PAS, ATPase and Fis domain/ABC-type branched-subunit amino acid transport system substrate-binding protein